MWVLPHHCQVPCFRLARLLCGGLARHHSRSGEAGGFVRVWKRSVFTYKTLTKWHKVIRIQPLNPAASGKPLNRERLQNA